MQIEEEREARAKRKARQQEREEEEETEGAVGRSEEARARRGVYGQARVSDCL
jgi:hypothetical protein